MRPRAGVGLLALALLGAAPARAETKFFPLPMYTTVPNEGSTYGVMPVFLGVRSDTTIQSITAPSVSWNSSAGFTGTYRYYRFFGPLGSWHFIISASTHVNRNLWFQYDDNRRDPQASTKNLNLRVRRNLFYRFFGLGPDTLPAGESSYTRLTAVAYGRWGYNFTRNFNVGPFLQVQGDKPEVHAISGLPETQVVYPDAPGLGGSAFARQGLSLRYDTREGREYALSGFATELAASLAEGISGVGLFGEFLWNTEILVPETRFLRLAGRFYVRQVVGSNIPFYDQASLGGSCSCGGIPRIDSSTRERGRRRRNSGSGSSRRTSSASSRSGASILSLQWARSTGSIHRGRGCASPADWGCGPGSSPTSSDASTWPTAARACVLTLCWGIRTDVLPRTQRALAGRRSRRPLLEPERGRSREDLGAPGGGGRRFRRLRGRVGPDSAFPGRGRGDA